jgi:pyridine nucleotide-disulfide oxidoreductase family protein
MKRLVLVGGGHSHALALASFRQQPPPGAEIVLISPMRWTAYSGMVPGLIAGDYTCEACHIDLQALAASAGVRFIVDRAASLDTSRRQVLLESGASVEYDLLSLNIGSSTPAVEGSRGAHLLTVKPIDRFLNALQSLWLRARKGRLSRIAIVGGGAAGVELALTLHHRMNASGNTGVATVLVSGSRVLLSERGAATSRAVEQLCRARGWALVLGAWAKALPEGILLAGGGRLEADAIVWSTGVAAPAWLSKAGLATDSAGFLSIDRRLQSVSRPEVFAAGDCASNIDDPHAKSGVFAVRQGHLLAVNLRRALAGTELRTVRLSPHALGILNCGGRYALASWRGRALAGRAVWRWKDWLDRRFMRRVGLGAAR